MLRDTSPCLPISFCCFLQSLGRQRRGKLQCFTCLLQLGCVGVVSVRNSDSRRGDGGRCLVPTLRGLGRVWKSTLNPSQLLQQSPLPMPARPKWSRQEFLCSFPGPGTAEKAGAAGREGRRGEERSGDVLLSTDGKRGFLHALRSLKKSPETVMVWCVPTNCGAGGWKGRCSHPCNRHGCSCILLCQILNLPMSASLLLT